MHCSDEDNDDDKIKCDGREFNSLHNSEEVEARVSIQSTMMRTSSRLSPRFVLMRDNPLPFSSERSSCKHIYRFPISFLACLLISLSFFFIFVCAILSHSIFIMPRRQRQRHCTPKGDWIRNIKLLIVECHKKVGTSFVEKLQVSANIKKRKRHSPKKCCAVM